MKPEKIRLYALLKLLGGAAGFAAVFWYVLHNGAEPVGGAYTSHRLAIAAGVPGAFAMVGLFELCSGISFMQVSARWDMLHAWQRGVFGSLIVVLALALVAGIFLGLAYFRII